MRKKEGVKTMRTTVLKRWLPILLCLVVMVGLFSVTAYAANDETFISQNDDGTWYAMKNGVVVKNGWVSEVKDGCIY